MQTQIKAAAPPPLIDKDILVGFWDDDIRDLGDEIANLTTEEAEELSKSLDQIRIH